MSHLTFDDALMNAIYLSEKWAAMDLERIKLLWPLEWNEEKEMQLKDEWRHANMCLNALELHSKIISHDVRFAMQEKLYELFINMRAMDIPTFNAIQETMEARAVWVFKTYHRIGENQLYKNVYQNILRDEERHQLLYIDLEPTPFFKELKKVDRFIFRKFLPMNFGSMMFKSEPLWKWYYSLEKHPILSQPDLKEMNVPEGI